MKWQRLFWTGLLGFAGATHFVMPDFFLAYYPSYLPAPREAILLSGIMEWVLAGMLWIPRAQRAAWYGIMALMVIYVPVHVYVVTDHANIQHPVVSIPLWLAWLRLPIQAVFIWLTWRAARTTK